MLTMVAEGNSLISNQLLARVCPTIAHLILLVVDPKFILLVVPRRVPASLKFYVNQRPGEVLMTAVAQQWWYPSY